MKWEDCEEGRVKREGSEEGKGARVVRKTLLTAELNFVLMIPGARQLTLISGANSVASALVRPMRAVLLVE